MRTENDIVLAQIMERLEGIQKDVNEIKTDLREVKQAYVTKTEFDLTVKPLQRFVYGLVTLVMTTVLGAILALVVNAKV